MSETGCFTSDSNQLAYSCTIPTGTCKNCGILFVHAAGGNRLGPHRMFVELANRFNTLGYTTFRFDMRGCGYSTGEAAQGDFEAEIKDLTSAIDLFIDRFKLESVILFGISRGARICYSSMARKKLPLKGMILLSMPVSSVSSAVKSLGSSLKEYFRKFTSKKHLHKLLTGKANLRQIGITLLTAVGIGRRYKQIEPDNFASNCPALLIYGGHDPIAEESHRYYTAKYRQNAISYDCHFIPQANHSFFHYKWKDEIFEVSHKWLEKIELEISK